MRPQFSLPSEARSRARRRERGEPDDDYAKCTSERLVHRRCGGPVGPVSAARGATAVEKDLLRCASPPPRSLRSVSRRSASGMVASWRRSLTDRPRAPSRASCTRSAVASVDDPRWIRRLVRPWDGPSSALRPIATRGRCGMGLTDDLAARRSALRRRRTRLSADTLTLPPAAALPLSCRAVTSSVGRTGSGAHVAHGRRI